jgi:hypothetical protein
MFLDEESMNDCIRKAMEWCEGLPSHDATYVKKMELSESIGVTLFITSIFYFYLRYSVISIKTYKTASLSAVLCN